MKTYTRNARFWEQTQIAFLHRAQLWAKGSEARALIEVAQSEDWLETFTEYAPASERVSPEECAAVIFYKLLS
jgi:hypothetical protein